MQLFGTQYRWTKTQRIRSSIGNVIDYKHISERFLENGALTLCQTCERQCKIPAPSIPVRFICYDYSDLKRDSRDDSSSERKSRDYTQAGGEIPKPSEKTADVTASVPPSPLPPNSKEYK
jgi:hypothetical protein